MQSLEKVRNLDKVPNVSSLDYIGGDSGMIDRALEIDKQLEQKGYGFTMRRKEVLEVLAISRETLNKLRIEGDIGHTTIRRQNRYYRLDVAKFMAFGEPG